MSVSESEKPTPEPGDAEPTEVETPTEAPSPLETPADDPAPVEEPTPIGEPQEAATDEPITAVAPAPPEPPSAPFSTSAAFSAPTPPPDLPGGADDGGSTADKAAELASDRPEVLVGAAFAGGLAIALLLRRLGG